MSEERRCLVVDEQPALRAGVRQVLGERYEVEGVPDGDGALEMLATIGEFDVAIVALGNGLPESGLCGMAAIRALRKARPGLGIVAHGPVPERRAAAEALGAGATAYVAKSSELESLERAVDAAATAERFVDPATGGRIQAVPRVTRRQREILQLYADGLSTAAVSRRLGLGTETVRSHTKALLSRLSASDRTHAVAIGLRAGLIA